jgi:hypothetical protein
MHKFSLTIFPASLVWKKIRPATYPRPDAEDISGGQARLQFERPPMKNLSKVLRASGITLTLAATIAVAQATVFPPIIATADENGNGRITGLSGFGLPDPYTLPYTMALEPISGLTTLCYTLPTSVTLGDIFLTEPGPAGQIEISDLIRFSGNNMYFFSDRTPGELGPFDLADVGVPAPDPTRPTRYLPEIGPEGNNGAFYQPLTASDPGFAAVAPGSVGYNFISDVPEPNSLALLGLAGVAVLLRKRS